MVTMTARQPGGVAAEIQQLDTNCNSVQVFERVAGRCSSPKTITQWDEPSQVASVWINQRTFNTFNFPSNPMNAPVFNTMGSKPVCPSPICRLHGQPGSQSVEAPETSPLRLPPHPFSATAIPRDCVFSHGYFTTYLRGYACVIAANQ